MSADLHTYIEITGKQKEIKDMVMAIKGYCDNNQDNDTHFEFPRIGTKKKFDGKNDFELDTMSKKAIDSLVASSKKIYIEAEGPYGRYGRVDEAGIFETISEVAPNAKFKAITEGFTTGQKDSLSGELKKGKLYITYRCLPNDCPQNDDEEEWVTEKCIYDPIKKAYKREYTVEEYVASMMNQMPLTTFKSEFGLSKLDISMEMYHDYIYECYCSYQFPNMGYIDFKYAFPNAEIDEEEFGKKVKQVIEECGLVSYESFCT